jgi:ABC-type multidrug transport system ATPase subunit
MLKAIELSKRYGKTLALDGFSLEVRPGEIVGLVGT